MTNPRRPRRPWARLTHPGVLAAAAGAAAAAGVLLLSTGGQSTTATPPPTAIAATDTGTADPLSVPPTIPPAPTSTDPAPTPSSNGPAAPSTPAATEAPAVGDEQGWEQAATGFATAFTAPAADGDWAGAMAPWVSPALAASYQDTDPTRLPTGTLQRVRATSEAAELVVATVDYHTGLQLAIELIPDATAPAGWVVSTVLALPQTTG